MRKKRYQERGSSVVEVILAILVIGLLVLIIGNLPASVTTINRNRHLSLARDIASRQMDTLRKGTYNFTNSSPGDSLTFTDQKLQELSNATAVYQVSDCPLNICNSEDLAKKIKRIKVEVRWNENGENRVVELETLLAEKGLAQ